MGVDAQGMGEQVEGIGEIPMFLLSHGFVEEILVAQGVAGG